MMEKERRSTATISSDAVRRGRMVGNSTRLIDYAIQLIFDGYICVVEDHYTTRKANRLLFERIAQRLYIEHRHIPIKYDKNKLEISLKDNSQQANITPNQTHRREWCEVFVE